MRGDPKTDAALRELARRATARNINILDECFDKQLSFILNPAKRKALCCNRRSGKSTSVALYMIDQALKTAKGKFLYIGLTNDSAKGAMWSDILDTIIRKYKLDKMGVSFVESRLEIKFPNGAIIYLRGMDATEKQMNRVRGQKYQIVAIDEAQDFTQDLNKIINGVLDMTIAENSNAVILMCGTPGHQLGEHYWYKIWQKESQETDWTRFTWSWKDNVSKHHITGERICDSIQKSIDARLVANPGIVKLPEYRREVLGEWVLDDAQLVYKYNADVNNAKLGIPEPVFAQGCTYILSLDLGYYDATAFAVIAYNKRFDANMYVIESFKKAGLTITAVANEVKQLMKRYKFSYMVVDAANLQAVEEMKQVHDLPFIAAEKQGKEAHIALLNSDFMTSHIKIDKARNVELVAELTTLTWHHKALLDGRHKEDPKKENHLTDALLYAHHFSRHYWYRPTAAPLSPDDALTIKLLEYVSRRPKAAKYMRSIFETDREWE